MITLILLITLMSSNINYAAELENALQGYFAINNQSGFTSGNYEQWLRSIFPNYLTRPFADFHHDFWKHTWGIEKGKRPRPYIAPWFRAGAKSASMELGCVALGARKKRRYGWYIHAIQGKANDHLANIRSMLEEPKLVAKYPQLGTPQIGKQTSAIRGWNMERLWTAGDFIMDAYGLDAGLRGARLGDARPDFIVFDDIDEDTDGPGMIEKKIELMTKKILPAGAIEDLAIFFMQTLTHRDSIMYRLVNDNADFLQNRIISMGGALPILTDCKIERNAEKKRWFITKGIPRWTGMTVNECQALLDDWGYRAFQTEGLQNVDTPYEGAIFPAFNPVYHVITYSEFMRVFGNQMRWQHGVMRPLQQSVIFKLPEHGHKYFAQDVGTTVGHPCVSLWAYQPGEDMPCYNSLFFYREMCRPKFPQVDELEIVSPLRLGMEIQDIERATSEKISWRIGSHEQKITRNSYEVDLPLVPIPNERDNNGKQLFYKTMQVDAIDTGEKGMGISTTQDLLMIEQGVPHPFRLDPRTNKPLDGCPRMFYLVPDEQGALYIDSKGQLKAYEAIDERGFSRTRWEFPKYRHRITASGEEAVTTRKIDDDAMDVVIAMCAKAQMSIMQLPLRAKAIKSLPRELHPDNIANHPLETAEVSMNYHIKSYEREQKKKNTHFLNKYSGLGK